MRNNKRAARKNMRNTKSALVESIMAKVMPVIRESILNEVAGENAGEASTLNIELAYFPGFYNTFDDLISQEIENEVEYYNEEYDKEYVYDDFEFDFDGFAEDVVELFVDVWKEYAPKFITDIADPELDRPREYNFRTDKVYADIKLADGWKKSITDFMKKNETALRKDIREDWSSRSGFWSFLSNDIDEWYQQVEDEDDKYIGQLIAYMMRYEHGNDIENTIFREIYDKCTEKCIVYEHIKEPK